VHQLITSIFKKENTIICSRKKGSAMAKSGRAITISKVSCTAQIINSRFHNGYWLIMHPCLKRNFGR